MKWAYLLKRSTTVRMTDLPRMRQRLDEIHSNVHGDARGRHHVAEVRDRRCRERALGALDEELVLLERPEDNAEVA